MKKISITLILVFASSFAFCNEKNEWDASYLKVESEELKILNVENDRAKFNVGLFLSKLNEQSHLDENEKDENYNFSSGGLGYSVSYQIKF